MAVARYKEALTLTEHAPWAQRFWDALVPLKERVARHPLFVEMGDGSLSLGRFRDALLHFYPLVEHFPKYMGLALAKTRPGLYPGHEETKNWLIGNIKIEQRHAYWYQDWAAGFGLGLERWNTPARRRPWTRLTSSFGPPATRAPWKKASPPPIWPSNGPPANGASAWSAA